MRLSVQSIAGRRLPIGNCPGMRIAQISGSKALDSAEMFPGGRWSQLAAFRPNALAGSASDLHRVVERIDLGTLELHSVDRCIFVLTEIGDRPLTDVTRVILWQRFGVPVYEMYVDGQQKILAFECEAHEGWHVLPNARLTANAGELVYRSERGNLVRTGLLRALADDPCPCGRAGSRIVDAADMQIIGQPFAVSA